MCFHNDHARSNAGIASSSSTCDGLPASTLFLVELPHPLEKTLEQTPLVFFLEGLAASPVVSAGAFGNEGASLFHRYK